ncbi:hypothetical protein BOX15_Mlig032342g3, partial [Macrostomum lignano]
DAFEQTMRSFLLAVALLVVIVKNSLSLNCGPAGDGQCSAAWRTYQLELESAWSAYKRPLDIASCSIYEQTLKSDLSIFAGGVHRKDIDEAVRLGGILYQIIDGKLYRNSSECRHFSARCSGVEHYLLRAAPRVSRNVEFVINVADYPLVPETPLRPAPVMSFSKSDGRHRDILYPTWSFSQGGPCLHPIYSNGIGDWNGTRQQLLAAAQAHPWSNKTDVAFFRGSRTSQERDAIVLLSLAKPELFDARYTKNQAYKSAADTLNLEPAPYVSLPEHCKYRYLINMRGVAASFRLRHILLCGSAVLHAVDKNSNWREFFYPAMRPWIHYVPLLPNLRDAEDKLLFLRANPDWAKRLAAEGAHFIDKHLRDSDVACYWLRLLRRFSRLLSYDATLRDNMRPV